MTTPSTTLASLWVDDGSPIKVEPVTPSKVQGSEMSKDFERFFKDVGLDPIAKQTGIMDGNGELVVTTLTLPQLATPNRHVITISSPSAKAILPKGSDAPSSAVTSLAYGTPQRTALSFTTASPLVDQTLSRKRGASDVAGYMETSLPSESKRGRKSDKGGKGLRHFSMKVCEKVQKKGITSYNEVADELVAEFTDPRNASPSDQQYDQKNIRRRVYDALNVLMAMNIISKEKKEIQWIGLPTNSVQECTNLELERNRRAERIRHKMQQLQELIVQQIAFKNLVQRNRERERTAGGGGTSGQQQQPTPNSIIQLPFIIVNTSKKTVIDCSISNDKSEYLFNFDKTFEIHDDIEVLKRMGMALGLDKGQCSEDDLRRAASLVPKALQKYVYDMARGGPAAVSASIPAVVGGPSASSLALLRSTDSELSSLSRSSTLYGGGGTRTSTLTPDEFSDDDDDSNSGSSSPTGGS